jgi:hypothetical protein
MSLILAGPRPGDLPIEQASKLTFVINLKPAKALGITVPPALLSLADQVIERVVHFRNWHETDIPTALRDVRSQGQSGKHLVAASISPFDPSATSRRPVRVVAND